jgi:hypothetical protein
MVEKWKSIISKGVQYNIDNPREITDFFKSVFNEDLCRYCPGKIHDKFLELSQLNEHKLNSMLERKYRMLPGKLIDTYNSSELPQGHWTDKNITDEVAEKLIKAGFGKFFKGNPTLEENPIEEPTGDEGNSGNQSGNTSDQNDQKGTGELTAGDLANMITASDSQEPVIIKLGQEQSQVDSPAPVVIDLNSKSFKDLVQIATEKQLPQTEWKTKNRAALIAYLSDKI